MESIDRHIASLDSIKNKKLYLACSGGLDSMVLLEVVSEIYKNVTVLHLNYGLRGEESDQDELFVRTYCKRRGLQVITRKSTIDQEGNVNIQLFARKERYEWFREILDIDVNNRVLLAHHADDQVETFFMNLIRKSGVMGLAAMPEEVNGIVRPLLGYKKAELEKYAKNKQLNWREDSSNKELKYVRNSWRNEYIPFLEKQNPDLSTDVLLLISKFQDLQRSLEQKVKPIVANIINEQFISLLIYNSLNELEKVEFWRTFNQHASFVDELERLRQKGKTLRLTKNDHGFDLLVREADGYSLIKTNTYHKIPELIINKVKSLPAQFDLNSIYLDPIKIIGKLNLRRWENGDRIAPIGLTGSKLVSDILSDNKLRFIDKLNTLVLTDEEKVLWVVGLKIGRHAIADSKSKEIIKISLVP